MTYFDSAYYEELQGRLRGLLIRTASGLPRQTAEFVDELIDVNECGLALEVLAEVLAESGAVVSSEVVGEVEQLVQQMGLDAVLVENLRLLVR